MGELERVREALNVAVETLGAISNNTWMLGSDMRHAAGVAIDGIERALDPPPEMETTSVVGWRHKSLGDYTEDLDTATKWGDDAAGFTCTFQRPKPVKVERSAKLTLRDQGWMAEGDLYGEGPWHGVFIWQE